MKRSVLVGIALWCVVAAAASTVAWVAIDQVGQDVVSTPPGALPSSSATVPVATPSASPTATPTPSPGSSATPRPTRAPSVSPSRPPVVTTARPSASTATTTVTRTWTGTAGTVRASCTGSAARLVSATPADGWRVERTEGGSEVKVRFERAESEVEVEARCVSGRPVFTVENKD